MKKLSISELNTSQNNELLQLAYFNEKKFSKKTALIIEDSKAISRILQDYLKDLGFADVCVTSSGREAAIIFNDLKKLGRIPTILLDDTLPDIDSRELVSEILDLTPEIKIILCTANSQDDSLVKEMIDLGIFGYIRKPIRFHQLQDLMQTIKEEQSRNEKHERNLEIQLLTLIKSSERTSLSSLANACHMHTSELLPQMDLLVSSNKVTKLDELREVICNRCSSSKLSQLFHCPSCNSSNFRQGVLYEHFPCGNITPSETYKDDVCPKCHKEIKILGVDYRQMDEYYICNDCGDQFTQLPYDFQCQSCNNQFKIDSAKWVSNPTYKIGE